MKKTRAKQIENVLHAVNLQEHKNQKIGGYSGGMRRRLGIAQALLGRPKIIMVDEPTAGLDPEERIRFRGLLRQLASNRMIVLSTHIVEDIESICDQVGVISGGIAWQFQSLEELSSFAKGTVWEMNIKETEYDSIANKMEIISPKRNNDILKLRVISEQKPSKDAISVLPTVEEGYLQCINSKKESL